MTYRPIVNPNHKKVIFSLKISKHHLMTQWIIQCYFSIGKPVRRMKKEKVTCTFLYPYTCEHEEAQCKYMYFLTFPVHIEVDRSRINSFKINHNSHLSFRQSYYNDLTFPFAKPLHEKHK